PVSEKWRSPLPFKLIQNWPAVGVNLITATIQGIQAFIGDLGGLTSTLTPAVQAPVSNTPVSTLAAARTSVADPTDTTDATDTTDNKKSTAELTLVKDADTSVQQTTVEKDTTPAATEETSATKPDSTVDEKKADDKKAD